MFKNYYQVREWLEKFIPQVYGKEELGLARIEYLLKLLGDPQDKFKSIHIAGTAGKGSTCFYIARLLSEQTIANGQWRKIGLHVSPHLVDIRERLQINGRLIPMTRFIRLINKIRPIVEEIKRKQQDLTPSYFEILVAASFKYFAEEKVDYAVVEVGLGGRLDATNVLKPEIAVITNIGLDHTDMLGNSVEKIAKEKAGIIKKGIPVVTATSGKALKVIENVAKRKSSTLVKVNTQKLPIGLPQMPFSDAPFLAIATLKQLKIPVSQKVIKQVFSETFVGRFEEIDKDVIIDGAHNPDKIRVLIKWLTAYSKQHTAVSGKQLAICLVVAFKKGKNWKSMVDLLLKDLPIERVIATSFYATTDTGKFSAVSSKEIFDYLNTRYKILDTRYYGNSQQAVFEAINANSKQLTVNSSKPASQAMRGEQSAVSGKQIVLVTGSLYLVGEVRTMWHLPTF